MKKTISVIVPHRSECAGEVEATARSFEHAGADEVILIYDGDGRGPAWARNEGLLKATGDFVCWTDAHVRWLEGDFKKFCRAAKGKVVVVAPCSSMEEPDKRTAYGAELIIDSRRPGYRLQPHYHPRSHSGALYGSVYAMDRQRALAMGGWPKTLSWGYNEQAMTMALKKSEIKILVDAGCRILHRFRNNFPYPIPHGFPLVNRMIAHSTFSDDWETFWRPKFMQYTEEYKKWMEIE